MGSPDPTPRLDQPGVQELIRVTNELRDDVAYKRRRHRELYDQMVEDYNKLSHYRLDDRAEFAVSQLDNERSIRSLRDELTAARQEIAQSREQIASLGDQTGHLKRDHTKMVSALKHKGVLRLWKRPRTISTDGDVYLET